MVYCEIFLYLGVSDIIISYEVFLSQGPGVMSHEIFLALRGYEVISYAIYLSLMG